MSSTHETLSSVNKRTLLVSLLITLLLLLGHSITKSVRADEAEELQRGRPIEREIATGERHTYQIRLAKDDYLSVKIEQHGIDVAVKVFSPDGKQILESDSEPRKQGEEIASVVAEAAGAFRLSVESAERASSAGYYYKIRVAELRSATENDRALYEARELYEQGNKLLRAGKYDDSLPLIEHALEIREKILGSDNADVADALHSLAALFLNKGEYAKAEPLYQRAVTIYEKTVGPEHPSLARSLNNLAVLYWNKSEYARAELFARRALAILENTLGREHPNVAKALNTLAMVYSSRGDLAKAEPLYQRVLATLEDSLEREHPYLATALSNLANVYYYQGDYAKAEPLYRRALAIGVKTLGPDHSEISRTLVNLASVHLEKGEYAKAEPLFRQALAIREKALGPEHPNVGLLLGNLADLHRNRADYSKAEPLYQRARLILESTLGTKHPYLANLHNNLAMLYAAKGDLVQATASQSLANAIDEHNLELNLRTGSERQKLAYLATLSEQTDRTLSLHLRYLPNDPTARDLATNTILQRKGRTLDAMSDSLAVLRQHFNPGDRVLLDRWNDVTAQLASLVIGGPNHKAPTEQQEQIKALGEEKESLEDEISRRSSEFRANSQPITLAAVQSAIPTSAVLIEFASYRPFNANAIGSDREYGAPRYVAYLLRREGEIKWQELGEARAIDDAIAAFRTAISDPKRRDIKRLARAVDEKVMRPLRPMLGDAKHLLVSPDGDLNLIPFEALVNERDQYLIARYSFTYLATGRDLLRIAVERESKSDPLVIADPMFGKQDQPVNAEVALRKLSGVRLRQSVTTGSDRSNLYFAPLLGTEQEAKEIKSLFPETEVLLGELATEASLKRAVAPRILHIATHGFFLEDRPVRLEGTRGPRRRSDLRELASSRTSLKIENPLLRSGLALAGANQSRGNDDDGILTALEASGLNLWGTQLVVLSACDTGVGVVKSGEGVFGLRRALVLAGSETQVMSLWQVNDYATQKFMKAFYAGLKQGQGRGEALRRVKLDTMRQKGSEHPFYWAGFIQSGKWNKLSIKR
jgi:CHAT domain-containing protein/Tfp pilus assembly protein PilF